MNGHNTDKLYLNSYLKYKYTTGEFVYPPSVSEMFDGNFDNRPVWEIISDDNIASENTASEIKNILETLSESADNTVRFEEFNMKFGDSNYRRCSAVFTHNLSAGEITIVFSYIKAVSVSMRDELTGLLNRKTFSKELSEQINGLPEDELSDYIVVYLDVLKFKVINDVFGASKGDKLLVHIAKVISEAVNNSGLGCRVGSDRFLIFTKCPSDKTDEFMTNLLERISEFDLPFEVICNAGIFDIKDRSVSAESVIDRAIMAQKSNKGNYTHQYTYYTEKMRNELVTEQEISGLMKTALAEEQFVIYYQPQYNHTTGMLVGAEALVRWKHPEKGLISPGVFIPIFEKNGFISKLDMYVFEKTCQFLQKCIRNRVHVVPVSINLTRYDIFSPGFIDTLEETRKKYDIPSKYIRVEITESAALGNSEFINEAVRKLHSFNYKVEMDDFGSGYSSLNILKDIDFDIIKLDMKFLNKDNETGSRGNTILSSVIRMVNWLGLPVIAEGVETVNQADFLGSLGCEYIQGFLYSKPVPEEEYEKLISGNGVCANIPQMNVVETLNYLDFWSNDSIDRLVFSSFVGASAIFEYKDGKVDILSVNKKYLREISMNMTESELIKSDAMAVFDNENRLIYTSMLEKAIETGEEQECETWRTISSDCCGSERICLKSTVQLMGESKGHYLFHSIIRNITKEKIYYEQLTANEKKFKIAYDQINIFSWEYNIATREMRPCFRCMKELGLPPLVRNYPDPVYESGLFPEETREMYYDWMKQLENGVEKLEAVIPLTADRIPFRVRYTTEFDETGRPVKAYGSAVLEV